MLNVSAVSKTYEAEGGQLVQAARNVTFEVPRGKMFTLLGPSGCGKTTTLRSVAGLEKPDSGEITVDEPRREFTSSRTTAISAWSFSPTRSGRT